MLCKGKLALRTFLSHLVGVCVQVVAHGFFRWFIIATIVFAGVVIGIETYPSLATRYRVILQTVDQLILAIFALEIVVKIVACGGRPGRFFRDGWNVFDFIIVVVCFLPFDTKFVYVVRLVRILRVLRLITALPRLQIIVGALLRSVPSMGYVSALLFILFYIYAVVGVHLFGGNDPVHFADLYVSFLSLFRVVTLEDWTDIMYIAMYGCDRYGYGDILSQCVAPHAYPFLAPLFFVSFVLLGTMIMLNLFIGVIVNNMTDLQKQADLQARLRQQRNHSIQQEFSSLTAKLEKINEHLLLIERKILQTDREQRGKKTFGAK